MDNDFDNIIRLILGFSYKTESISFSIEDISFYNSTLKFSIHLFDNKIKSRYYSLANLDIEIFNNNIHILDIISRFNNHNYGIKLLKCLLQLTKEIQAIYEINTIHGELVKNDYSRWKQLYKLYNKLTLKDTINVSLIFDDEKLSMNSLFYVCDVPFKYILL